MRMAIIYLNSTERVKIYSEGGMGCEAFVEGIGWVVRDEIPDSDVLKGLIATRDLIAKNIEKLT